MMSQAFWVGFFSTLSLILPIGAQNAFVLKQGLRGEFVLPIVLFCAASDALLISTGVGGFNHVIERWPLVEVISRYGGAVFLGVYGVRSIYTAWTQTKSLTPSLLNAPSLGRSLFLCAAFTWLNPHVYLDTVILIGAIATQFPTAQLHFTIGAILASVVFFFTLGFGAALLRPWFARPIAWRVLDNLIGLLMCAIACQLAFR